MVLPQTGQSRLAKWTAKYDPDTIRARFAAVKDVAVSRAQVGLMAVADVQSIASKVLNEKGITGGLRITYIAFAEKVWRESMRYDSAALDCC